MCRGFESHPSSSFFFSEKKELFGLVAFPLFSIYRKEFSCTHELFPLAMQEEKGGSSVQRCSSLLAFTAKHSLDFSLSLLHQRPDNSVVIVVVDQDIHLHKSLLPVWTSMNTHDYDKFNSV